eukprot:NODE_411_length_2528_cov_94.565904_g390_i0.p1 GENE.NODE_411_length_2528_cov_94.565904_g390_i0~~NODE_411_length_2528_cov_94.565904_g390_i0.p1  ORF type:complete len:553 (+),score=75.05 NODE_411_length_2528_cov_94.565904_g390_i0:646-2304(+)
MLLTTCSWDPPIRLQGVQTEGSDHVVADPPVSVKECPVAKQSFKMPSESNEPQIRAVDAYVTDKYGSWNDVPAGQVLFELDGNLVSIEEVTRKMLKWRVVVLVPQDEFLSDSTRNRNIVTVVEVCVGIITCIACSWFAIAVRRPLLQVIKKMDDLERFIIDTEDENTTKDSLLKEVAEIQQGNRRLQASMEKVKSFVPQSVLAELQQDGYEEEIVEDDDGPVVPSKASLQSCSSRGSLRSLQSIDSRKGGGKRRSVHHYAPNPHGGSLASSLVLRKSTVVVFNIRNFHSQIKSMRVADVQELVHSTVECAMAVIKDTRGVLDFFQGDRICISYGTVAPIPSATLHALTAGLSLTAKLHTTIPSITTTCGIATSDGIVGNMGSAAAKRFGIISIAYKQAAALERLCKMYSGVPILASHRLLEELQGQVVTELVDVVMLPGHAKPVKTLVGCPRSLPGGEADEWMYELQQGNAYTEHNERLKQFLKKSGNSEPPASMSSILVQEITEDQHAGENAQPVGPGLTPSQVLEALVTSKVDGAAYYNALPRFYETVVC